MYHEPLTYHLHDLGFKVSIINPAFIKHHADGLGVRQKTDKKTVSSLPNMGRQPTLILGLPQVMMLVKS
ncbi:transposase [Moraxella lacunata]|uniref:transposase n=1 Tax=Moraxella lacunata TaxID=477 RepID=UPI000E0E2911